MAGLLNLTRHGLAANPTSPRAQVEGFSKISDSDLRVILGHGMFIDMSCPTDLFIQMVHITRLRVQIENNALQPNAIQTIADAIFNRIDDFDPDNWTESYKLSDTPVVPSIAHTYKLAVALYGILSLPLPVFIRWSAARSNTHSYQHQLVTRRSALLARARVRRGRCSSTSRRCAGRSSWPASRSSTGRPPTKSLWRRASAPSGCTPTRTRADCLPGQDTSAVGVGEDGLGGLL